MHRLLSATISAVLIAFSLIACSDNPFPPTVKAQTTTSHKTLQAFRSDDELKAYLREVADEAESAAQLEGCFRLDGLGYGERSSGALPRSRWRRLPLASI